VPLFRFAPPALAGSLIAVALSGTAFADPPSRRVEVGGFLGLDYFGDDIELGNSWAPEQVPGTSLLAGARATFIALPDLAKGSSLDPQLGVEAEAKLAFASTGESDQGGRPSYFTPVLGWRLQLIARLRTGGVLTPHLVVGAGGETVFTGSPFMTDDTDAAFHWGPGVSWRLTDSLDARVDLRHGVTAGRLDDPHSTFEIQFGLATGWDLAARASSSRPPADRDGDGIVDREDTCPDQPETVNGFRDADGCPDLADRDGDGILDPDDECLDEPETQNGIDDADGCPELDADGDGLIGSVDKCPTEAEDFDHFQDEDGCPERDNDGDTKPDVSDVCPDQPETYNGFDDEDGCPDELPKVLKEYTGAIAGITFEYGRARIQPRSKTALNKAATTLREYASIRLRVEGHSDDRGPRDRNILLSHKRAEAVKWYLVDQGIAADRIEPTGHGPDVPVASNKTAKGRAANRRIEFHIVFQDPRLVPALQTAPVEPVPAAPAPAPVEPVPAAVEPVPAPAGELR